MKTLLVLNVSPALEDELADYLLSTRPRAGFTSRAVHGHGEGRPEDMSIAEQVSGRRKRLEFVLIVDESEVDALLDGVRKHVGRGILWWQQPLLRQGRL